MVENDDLTCSICLEEIFPVHKIIHTPCSHTYHDECFEKYVISLRDNNKAIRCPICRSDIINEPYATPPHSPLSTCSFVIGVLVAKHQYSGQMYVCSVSLLEPYT